ncbi:hypothetical protein HK100_001803 [Physocladia obscura]|uniref:DNA polymerase kappa n=1 Tax=Physocladia obscura TaxID=109957 RepID=A0AAD5XJM3_9FUNG|nr:hypothetical protein HK100_001803 [Physocladia obscura]
MPVSLDEAYLDLTGFLQKHPEITAEETVQKMRQEIFEATQITASAGIGPNRMIAKVCSDLNKPNGQYIVKSNIEAIIEFMKDLPIRKISGIGNVAEQYLKAFGVEKCGDLASRLPLLYLVLSPALFSHCIDISLGIGSNKVDRDDNAIPKGMGREQTAKMNDAQTMYKELEELAAQLETDLAESSLTGRCICLKMKDQSFTVSQRSKTLQNYISSADDIFSIGQELLVRELQANPKLKLRLIGLRMSSLILTASLQEKKTMFIKNENEEAEKAKTELMAECPVCQKTIEKVLLNLHVISCLDKQDKMIAASSQFKSSVWTKCTNALGSSSFSNFATFEQSTAEASAVEHIEENVQGLLQKSNNIENYGVKETPDSRFLECPICFEVCSMNVAEHHVEDCYVRTTYPEMHELWKHSNPNSSAERNTSNKSSEQNSSIQNATSLSTCKVETSCKNCGFEFVTAEIGEDHISWCKKRSASARPQSNSKKPKKIARMSPVKQDHGITQYFGKAEKPVKNGMGTGSELTNKVNDPYSSSQGKKLRGVDYQSCPLCSRDIPKAFLNDHAADCSSEK